MKSTNCFLFLNVEIGLRYMYFKQGARNSGLPMLRVQFDNFKSLKHTSKNCKSGNCHLKQKTLGYWQLFFIIKKKSNFLCFFKGPFCDPQPRLFPPSPFVSKKVEIFTSVEAFRDLHNFITHQNVLQHFIPLKHDHF